jgi:hypothetical protein
MTRILRLLTIVALSLGMTAVATAANTPPITVDQLLASDVIVAPGATATADERSRIEQAAKDLAKPNSDGESFPTKFVFVPAPTTGQDLNEQAKLLWASAKTKLGDADKLDAVILLAPRAIGIAANAFSDEIANAVTKERPTLRRDRVDGTIAIMTTLQHLDAVNALPDGSTTETGSSSRSPLLWTSSAVILLIAIIGFIASRRVARKAARRLAAQDASDRDRAATDGAPPVEERQ